MRKLPILRYVSLSACMIFVALSIHAQNSIQVFGPVNVRPSSTSAGYGSPVSFNSQTLNLTCPASAGPITAVLSSSADSTGNVLVDNNIQLTVTSATGATTGPVNVCRGGTSDSTPDGPSQDCFTTAYQTPASAGSLNGQDPDTLLSTLGGGVPPIDISSNLLPGVAQQVVINLVDTGGWLASSTIYLNTSCSQTGVTGPAQISGNPILQTNPTPQQLTQNFTFNTLTGQQVQLVYDLSQAEAAQTLTITDNTIPGAGDMPIDPSSFQGTYVSGTSFATSSCLIHTGENLPSGAPACKLFTLECTVGTGSTASGAQCPISSLPNEVLQDIFDGPPFSVPDFTNSSGTTFHQGIGLLMASEGWGGGPCTFDPTSGLQDVLCPQNLLVSFSGPGGYTATGHVSHPNSTFIPIAPVPEDLTTITVAGQRPGGWINTSTANVTLSSQPPNLTGTNLPGASSFVPSPIQTITYGISPSGSVPTPANPSSSDIVVTNNVGCPSPSVPTDPPAAVFTPPLQSVSIPDGDGNYLLHYFAQDCAGTDEFQFTQDNTGSWSTNYYTFQINVDTIAPVVATGPVLSPAPGPSGYLKGQSVTATYGCTDERSGVVSCGASTFSYTSATQNTGSLTSPVNTNTLGNNTYTVTAVDAAGNTSSVSVPYVVAAFDTAIQLTLSPSTVTYPQGTNVTITVAPSGKHTPTGTVQLLDGTTVLESVKLQGNGAAYFYIQKLAVGAHILTAMYSGDANNPGGTSAPVTLNVKSVPVQLTASCWNANFPYGANYQCGIYASSAAGPPQGIVTYQFDGGAVNSLTLQNGVAQFTLTKPQTGNHTVIIGYAAQTNYAAAGPITEKFTVTRAPVVVLLTPSSWYVTGGNLTLNVTIQSWSAGPPNQLGTVTFSNGSNVLATVPVTSTGTASTTLAASSLSNGVHTLTASYSGSTNYSPGSAVAVITVAVK